MSIVQRQSFDRASQTKKKRNEKKDRLKKDWKKERRKVVAREKFMRHHFFCWRQSLNPQLTHCYRRNRDFSSRLRFFSLLLFAFRNDCVCLLGLQYKKYRKILLRSVWIVNVAHFLNDTAIIDTVCMRINYICVCYTRYRHYVFLFITCPNSPLLPIWVT